jgi:hypothetical protein
LPTLVENLTTASRVPARYFTEDNRRGDGMWVDLVTTIGMIAGSCLLAVLLAGEREQPLALQAQDDEAVVVLSMLYGMHV